MLVYLLQNNNNKTNKQPKIKFTHLVDDLQNCLDLQRKKNKVNNNFKINDYKMPREKSTLCALFMDQMRTKKQNKIRKKQTNKQQQQHQQIKSLNSHLNDTNPNGMIARNFYIVATYLNVFENFFLLK